MSESWAVDAERYVSVKNSQNYCLNGYFAERGDGGIIF
jgi:hypothetical protein